MRQRQVGKAELAKRLDWHLPQVDRVLNVRHGSQLDQLEAAFGALGKKLVLRVVDTNESKLRPQRRRPSTRPEPRVAVRAAAGATGQLIVGRVSQTRDVRVRVGRRGTKKR
jgi:hypothetical protein